MTDRRTDGQTRKHAQTLRTHRWLASLAYWPCFLCFSFLEPTSIYIVGIAAVVVVAVVAVALAVVIVSLGMLLWGWPYGQTELWMDGERKKE